MSTLSSTNQPPSSSSSSSSSTSKSNGGSFAQNSLHSTEVKDINNMNQTLSITKGDMSINNGETSTIYSSAGTKIGRRKSQEDRCVSIPKLFNNEQCFFAVFDGTVGHFTSHFCHDHVTAVLLAQKILINKLNNKQLLIPNKEKYSLFII